MGRIYKNGRPFGPPVKCFKFSLVLENDAIDDGLGALCVVAEGVAVEDGDVSILADFQRAHSVFQTQQLGGVQGDCLQCVVPAQAFFYSPFM